MAVKGKSARGVVVDFDLLRIKEQMASAPPSIDVKKRQDFVETKLRRRFRKKVPEGMVEAAIAEAKPIDATLPSVEGEQAPMIEAVEAEVEAPDAEELVEPTPSKTKQKARPKSKKST